MKRALLIPVALFLGSSLASPALAGGCKFVSAYAMSCPDGAGGFVNSFFDGERWNTVAVPAPTVTVPYSYLRSLQQRPASSSYYNNGYANNGSNLLPGIGAAALALPLLNGLVNQLNRPRAVQSPQPGPVPIEMYSEMY
ncbi:MAG: hypothetical protein RLZZ158_95 [Cyanobacteriota bacterium]|jgi:hypothetical protein